ncbi:MAG: STAS domain-containing protein [bacterium]|nr:STAS domain-containing protein [bacterium]
MKVEVQTQDKKGILSIFGDVDLYSVIKLKEELEKLITSDIVTIIVNMHNVTYIDSSGIGALIGSLKKITAKSGKLYLIEVPENVMKIFRFTSLHKIFHIYNTIAEIPEQ